MGCGCGKKAGTNAWHHEQAKKAQQAKQVSRLPDSRATYRKVLEEAARGKEQKTA